MLMETNPGDSVYEVELRLGNAVGLPLEQALSFE